MVRWNPQINHLALDFIVPETATTTVLDAPPFSVLETPPFSERLSAFTYIVVARAVGDVTLLDSGQGAASMELCHGCVLHVLAAHASPPVAPGRCMLHGTKKPSPSGRYPSTGFLIHDDAPPVCLRSTSRLLRGHTRSEPPSGSSDCAGWHLYTATFDRASSALFVDGVCEAVADVEEGWEHEASMLDRLTIGSNNCLQFPLKGAIAEVRVFACSLPVAHRQAIEASLAARYGLAHPAHLAEGAPRRQWS